MELELKFDHRDVNGRIQVLIFGKTDEGTWVLLKVLDGGEKWQLEELLYYRQES